jgi:hypothetical protein
LQDCNIESYYIPRSIIKDKISDSDSSNYNKLDFLKNKYNSLPQSINPDLNKASRFKISSAKKDQNDIEIDDIKEEINEISDFIAADKGEFSKQSLENLLKISKNETKNYIKNNKNFLNFLNNPHNNNINLLKKNDIILPSSSEMLLISRDDSSKMLNNMGDNYRKINNIKNSYQKIINRDKIKTNLKSRVSKDENSNEIYISKSNYNLSRNLESKNVKNLRGIKFSKYASAILYPYGIIILFILKYFR